MLGLVLSLNAAGQTHIVRSARIDTESANGKMTHPSAALPFRWDSQYPGDNGRASYTLALPAVQSSELQALYIPRVGNQVHIWVNGQFVYGSGHLDDTLRDVSQSPILVSLPASLLFQNKPNSVQVKTSVQALRWAGLSEIYIGSERELCHLYDLAVLWQKTSYVVILAALLLMGALSFFVWLKQRERLYLYFVWSALSGGIVLLDHLLTQFALPWPLHGIISGVALAWHVIFMSRFALEVAGRSENWVRLSMLASTLAVGIAYVLAEPVYWTMTMAMLCLPVVAALICSARAADIERSGASRGLFFVSLVVAVAALRDFFVVQWPDSGMSHFVLLPHALFLFVLVMGGILIRRYTEQHRLNHELSVSLEQRVNEREGQLKLSFEQLQREAEERAKLLERQRIMGDIHDGVGGHLVGLVNMMKRSTHKDETLLEHAQLALDELRTSVDAMQPVDGDLATVLATLRYRLAPRLAASGIELVWHVQALPLLENLTPQKVLQIQKILLEAFTNVMRHAKATQVQVIASEALASDALNINNNNTQPATRIAIDILDNGIGFDVDSSDETSEFGGHGLRNMRFRAEAIQAQISFARRQPQGMQVRLLVH